MAAPKRNTKTGTAKAENRILAYATQGSSSIPQTTNPEYDKDLGIYPFFKEDGNDFPQYLIRCYEKSPTHRSAINIKTRAMVGKGFIIKRKDGEEYVQDESFENWLNDCNSDGESLYHQFANAALDKLVIGNLGIEFNVRTANNVFNVFHQDVSTLRKGKNGKVLYSEDWHPKKKQDFKKVDFQAFNYSAPPNGKSMLYYSSYSPGRKNYSLPTYYSRGGMAWVEVEYKIPIYNLDRIDNKFMPSGLLTMIGEPPDGMTAQDYLFSFINRFTGEGNNAKLVAQLVSNHEQKPDYIDLDKEPDGIFTTLQTMSTEYILRMHNMHPGILMQTAGKLSNANEMRTIYDQFMALSVKPERREVMSVFNRIVQAAGFGDYYLEVQDIDPISVMNELQDLMAVLTVNELREQIGYKPIDDNDGTNNG